MRQAGSCVWFVGLSDDTGEGGALATSNWVNSFFGSLSSDFTLRGSWADLLVSPGSGVGVLDFRLNFAELGGEEGITLEVIEMSGGFGDEHLFKPETRLDLTVRLRDGDECVAVVAEDGETYEMLVPPGWAFGTPSSLHGPDGQTIRQSDEFNISGELARGVGSCGPGLIMITDRIEVSASP